jgi:hypothetical protein
VLPFLFMIMHDVHGHLSFGHKPSTIDSVTVFLSNKLL